MKAVVLILFGLGAVALGNGGGYFRGGVTGVGDVKGFEPKHTEKVRIVDERLTARLGLASAEVEVRYRMRNLTDRPVKVRFGFPVEESVGGAEYEVNQGLVGSDGTLQYCRNYRIEADGEAVGVKWEVERGGKKDKRFRGLEGWLVSELEFQGGEEKSVGISFVSEYPVKGWAVSDRGHESTGTFRYRLSTAAVWGGTIARGRIELIPDGIDPQDLRVLKPVNRFRKEGAMWVWEFEDLEPTLADDLSVETQPRREVVHDIMGDGTGDRDFVEYTGKDERWTMSHANYEVRASSTLAPEGPHRYGVENLRSSRKSWSEGAEGPGIGEWLELEPQVAKPLTAIRIESGYGESLELFEANARPKRVEVILNGEHRLEATLQDTKAEQRILVEDYERPVKQVKLVFKEIYPGSRFEDLCVSRVRLEVALDGKPEFGPVR